MKHIPPGCVLLFCLLYQFCLPGASAAGPLQVFVSIAPQAYIVEQLGEGHVAVHVLVPEGRNPHTFEPTPKQIMELGRATLYFSLGMVFEGRLLEKIRGGNSRLQVIDCTEGITKRPLTEEEEAGAHEKDGHQAGEPDPHVWLAPPLIKIMAANMTRALQDADPAHSAEYQDNYSRFSKRIDAVDARIRKLLKPLAGRTFYVFHPAFGYFGDTYGLRQHAVEMAGKTPTPKQLAATIAAAKADRVKIIFVQPQFDPKSATAIAAAIHGAVVPMDPMAGDLLTNLEEMAKDIEEALYR